MKKFYEKNKIDPPKRPFTTFICGEREMSRAVPKMRGGLGGISEQFKVGKQHAYDYYIKKALRNELRVCWREKQKRLSNEVTFSDLPDDMIAAIGGCDDYPCEHSTFFVDGYNIRIKNDCLAEALSLLSQVDRNILLMYGFMNMSDNEISIRLKMSRRTVNDRRHNTYQTLRKLMEGDPNGCL